MDMPEGFALAAIMRARGSARRVRVEPYARSLAELPPARVVGTSSLRREAQLRERDPHLAGAAAARQRQHAAAQARRRPVRRDHSRRRGLEAARASRSASPRCSIRTRACPRSGRARWRSNAAPIAPTSSPRLRRSPIAATTLATTAERAFARALAGSCHTPLAAYAVDRGTANCGCAGWSPAATAAKCCAANALRVGRQRRSGRRRSARRSAANSCARRGRDLAAA